MTDELRWDAAEKDAGETLSVTLSAFALCAQYWEPNEQWDAGEFSWPTTPTGFVFECTTPGRSAAKEPRTRGLIVDQTVTDGSVVWTLRVPTLLNGIQPITLAEAVAPDGIQVSGVIVNESTKILVDYSGGTDDEEYEVEYRFTIAGRLRIGRQVVHIAKK